MTFHCIGPLSALWSDDMQRVSIGARHVLVVRHGDQVNAFEDRCAHLGLPLSEGKLVGGVIACRAHGWCYDARTGRGTNPRGTQLTAFAVEVRDGQVWIDAEPAAEAERT